MENGPEAEIDNLSKGWEKQHTVENAKCWYKSTVCFLMLELKHRRSSIVTTSAKISSSEQLQSLSVGI
jgi:hypothetical protein